MLHQVSSLAPPHPRRRAFTLVELLVVVVILASLAALASTMVQGVEGDSALKIARSEMLEIVAAVERFRADTGGFPKQGAFDLAVPGRPWGRVPVSNLPAHVAPGAAEAWFDSPANFWQLLATDADSPLRGTGHAFAGWSVDTGRGFRGPYLRRDGEGYVDVGDGLSSTGAGSPAAGTLLSAVDGVADPFVTPPVVIGSVRYFSWRTAPSGAPRDAWGRPYLLLDLGDPTRARIVCLGPNRTYDDGAGDDIVIRLAR